MADQGLFWWLRLANLFLEEWLVVRAVLVVDLLIKLIYDLREPERTRNGEFRERQVADVR